MFTTKRRFFGDNHKCTKLSDSGSESDATPAASTSFSNQRTGRPKNRPGKVVKKESDLSEGMCPVLLLDDVYAYNGLNDSYIPVPKRSLLIGDTGSTVHYVKKTFSDKLLETGHALIVKHNVDLDVSMIADNRTQMKTDLVLIRLSFGKFTVQVKCLVLKDIIRPAQHLCSHTLSTLDKIFEKGVPSPYTHFNNKMEWARPNSPKHEMVLLIGQSQIWEFLGQSQKIRPHELYFIPTPLGVTISGTLPVLCKCPTATLSFATVYERLHNCLEKQFQHEMLAHDDEMSMSSSELQAFEYMKKNTHYDPKLKRFTVRLLWKPYLKDNKLVPGPPPLRSTFNIATSRFLHMERQLKNKSQDVVDLVRSSVERHIDAGFYVKVSPERARWLKDPSNTECFTLPPRLVFRIGDSYTTPVRYCFDASQMVPGLGQSLNDLLWPGPPGLNSMYRLQLRWRSGRIGFVMDVKQMFLALHLDKRDWSYNSFVYRVPNSNDPLEVYEARRVCFGLRCSPFMASFCLARLAQTVKADKNSSPILVRAATLLLDQIYMDDLLGFSNSVQDAQELIAGIEQILDLGTFHASKYQATNPDVLKNLAPEKRAKQGVTRLGQPLVYEDDDHILRDPAGFKSLGQLYQADLDQFAYGGFQPLVDKFLSQPSHSKRDAASIVAKIAYDLSGLRSGISMKCRTILRDVMLRDREQERKIDKASWDRPLDPDFEAALTAFVKGLVTLDQVTLDRYLPFTMPYELLGACDASNDGIAAAVYLRTLTNAHAGTYKISFVIGKAKVRSLQQLQDSIPRQELCSALLLKQLFETVLDAKPTPLNRCYAFTDSSAVFFWLQSSIDHLSPYVANRVRAISDLGLNQWAYIPSSHNPADGAAKGHWPEDLLDKNKPLWKFGASYWKEPRTKWPNFTLPGTKACPDFLSGVRKSAVIQTFKVSVQLSKPFRPFHETTKQLFTSTNDHDRLVSRVAAMLCFYYFLKAGRSRVTRSKTKKAGFSVKDPIPNNPSIPTLASMMPRARLLVFSYVQQQAFLDEFYTLAQGERLDSHSKLLQHTPLLDVVKGNIWVLRVHTRIVENKALSPWVKQPLLLPKIAAQDPQDKVRAFLTSLHNKLHHPTIDTLHNLVRFGGLHLLGGINNAKAITQFCPKCDRDNVRQMPKPLQADLPEDRSNIEAFQPFQSISLDHFGPVLVKGNVFADTSDVNTRATNTSALKKCWCLVVTCNTSRAISLVLSPSLSINHFLLAFGAHCGRHAFPKICRSDAFATFKGADRIFQNLFRTHSETLTNYARDNGFRWVFGIPFFDSSHGQAESAVKLVKKAAKTYLDQSEKMTFYELDASLQLAALACNLRPLAGHAITKDLFQAVTPFSLVNGFVPDFVHLSELSEFVNPNLRAIWESRCQKMDSFIQAFKKGYLESLAKRKAWNVDNTTSLQPGDICLLERNDAFSKKRLWPLVRVVSLIEARDKKFREALVQLGDADYKLNTHHGKKVYTVLKKPTVKKVSIQQLRRLQSWSQNKVTSAQPEDAGTLASRISHRKVVLTNIVQHNHVPYENRS